LPGRAIGRKEFRDFRFMGADENLTAAWVGGRGGKITGRRRLADGWRRELRKSIRRGQSSTITP